MKVKIAIIALIVVVLLSPIGVSLFTQNPEGTSVESRYYNASELRFFSDLTFQRGDQIVREQSILNQELAMIKAAQEFILMDMFLFNDAYDREGDSYPKAVQKITDALIAKKTSSPELPIVFITDPINGFYGSYEEEHLETMIANGIEVVETDLNQLKDSNFLYSGYYRILVKPFGVEGNKWITNPFDKSKPDIHIRAALRLLNFKANHRKLLVTEQGALITSANPHDGSSYHSNAAVLVNSGVVNDIIEGERVVAEFSGATLPEFAFRASAKPSLPDTGVRYLTEKSIFNALIDNIDRAKEGDEIRIGIFYISDFELVDALERAAARGVSVRIVADPNKDAFGVKKDGSPNRTVLTGLVSKSENVQVRWYDTHGEQYHTKLANFSFGDRNITILGSGNYTRRNLKGYNLEGDLEITTGKDSAFSAEVAAYFERIWTNSDGTYTVDFDIYKEDSKLKRAMYLIQEATGLCTY